MHIVYNKYTFICVCVYDIFRLKTSKGMPTKPWGSSPTLWLLKPKPLLSYSDSLILIGTRFQ